MLHLIINLLFFDIYSIQIYQILNLNELFFTYRNIEIRKNKREMKDRKIERKGVLLKC